MITVTKINDQVFYINPHLIERMEERPDTIITMDSQIQYIVKESIKEIIKKIVEYRKKLGITSQE